MHKNIKSNTTYIIRVILVSLKRQLIPVIVSQRNSLFNLVNLPDLSAILFWTCTHTHIHINGSKVKLLTKAVLKKDEILMRDDDHIKTAFNKTLETADSANE